MSFLMRRINICRCILSAVFCFWLQTTFAANFNKVSLGQGKADLITVEGQLEFGDEAKFINLAINSPQALVAFQSNGGNLIAGIEIGKAIRLKGFGTLVPDNVKCASACALAWLGGRVRWMGKTAGVGFHAATVDNGGHVNISSAANALVGAYLNQLGLPNSAVVYITSAPPEEVTWLNFEEARQMGIDVQSYQEAKSVPSLKRTVPSPTLPAPSASIAIHRVFDISREGSQIGTTTVDFSRRGEMSNIKIVTHISVKVLLMNAYQYEHQETASFRDNQLISFSSTTDDNGTNHQIAAHESSGRILMKVDGDETEVPKAIYPAITFSPLISSKSQLFDPNNGKRLYTVSEGLGMDFVTVHGVQQELNHIKLSGQFDRDLWFDRDGLVKMSMIGSDHSRITSELRRSSAER
jgi:hypothetical protein